MSQNLEGLVALAVLIGGIISSILTMVIGYFVFKATIMIKFNALRNDFDAFVDDDLLKHKETDKEISRISHNQQSKITSITSLEKKFDDFREDHIREQEGVREVIKENSNLIFELKGTLNVIKDRIK